MKQFMIQWNNRFPVDHWWREKHGIAFLSPAHRETSFIAQRLEFEEDRLFKELLEEKDYTPNKGDFMKPLTEKETTKLGGLREEVLKKEAKAAIERMRKLMEQHGK